MENILHTISVILILLRLVLWPSTWSFLVKLPLFYLGFFLTFFNLSFIFFPPVDYLNF